MRLRAAGVGGESGNGKSTTPELVREWGMSCPMRAFQTSRSSAVLTSSSCPCLSPLRKFSEGNMDSLLVRLHEATGKLPGTLSLFPCSGRSEQEKLRRSRKANSQGQQL